MGRMSTYLTILVVLDLLFIMFGQSCGNGVMCSPASVLITQILDPSQSFVSNWFNQLIGNFGNLLQGKTTDAGFFANLLSLLGATGIAVGSLVFGLKNESILWAPAGVVLAGLLGDLVNIYVIINSYSHLTAILIFAPITTIYVFTVVEWVRGMS